MCGHSIGHDRIELKDFFSFLGKYQDPNNLPVHGISSALISHHNQTFGVWFGSTVANVQVEDKIPHKDNTLWTKIAVCVALLAELYTTTSTPNAVNSINLSPGRTRLTVGVDPIADFGIVAGSDNEPNTTSHKQQEDHDTRVYWIYFKTFRENVWYLDWRVPFLDGAGPCIYPRLEDTSYFSPHASATCNTERNIKTGDYTSVLKDPHMLKALQDGEKSSDLYSKFTKKISGRESSPLEKSLMVPKVEEMRTIMRNHLMTTKSSQQGSGNN